MTLHVSGLFAKTIPVRTPFPSGSHPDRNIAYAHSVLSAVPRRSIYIDQLNYCVSLLARDFEAHAVRMTRIKNFNYTDTKEH